MKIVFDSLVFALHKYGGVITYWNEFIARFKRDKADLAILTVELKKYLNPDFIALMNGVRGVPENNLPLQVLRNLSPTIPSLREPFIFHSNYLRVSKNKHAINVVTIHDFTHQYFVKGIKQYLNYFQKRKAIGKADGIVCISKNTLDDLYHFFPEARSKTVKVIYNGCAALYVDPAKEDPWAKVEGPYILFVGARGNYKNFAFVIDIIRRSDHKLVVAGAPFTPEEEEQVRDIRSRITLLQGVDDKRLKALYQHAHAFIYPSLYEGFGIPLLEAMNCQCPVIAFRNSCIPEIMEDSPLLFENNNLQATLDALAKLENPTYRETVLQIQRQAAMRFSWEKAFYEMKAFYQELFDARKANS